MDPISERQISDVLPTVAGHRFMVGKGRDADELHDYFTEVLRGRTCNCLPFPDSVLRNCQFLPIS